MEKYFLLKCSTCTFYLCVIEGIESELLCLPEYFYPQVFVLLVKYIILILLPPLVKESSIEFIEHCSIVKINLEIKPLIKKS